MQAPWWYNLIYNPSYYSQFASPDYWSPNETNTGGGGSGIPTYTVTGTGIAPDNPPIDWSWMWNPQLTYGQGGPGTPPMPGGGSGTPFPTPPNPEEVLPLPPDETPEPIPITTNPPDEGPTLTWPQEQGFPWEWLLPGAAAGGVFAGGSGEPVDASTTWNPPTEPTEPQVPEGGVPTFPVDVTAPGWSQTGEIWNPFQPSEPQVPDGGVPTFPIDVTGKPPFEQTGVIYQPQFPGGENPGPWIQPQFPVEINPSIIGALLPQPGSTTTPPVPEIPNLGSVSTGGAPGPGLMAPVVGDPIADQSVFQGTGLPPQQGQMPDFSAILAQILQGGQYAAR